MGERGIALGNERRTGILLQRGRTNHRRPSGGAAMTPSRSWAAVVVAWLTLAWPRAGSAAEGMGTFDDVPTAQIQRAVGVTIDRPWIDHLRRSAVRLTTGCSAAVVSRRGLALTNQHCVLACAQGVSGAAGDALAEGFAADTLAAERRCPGMQAEILVGVIDVSGPVFAAGAGKAGAAFVAAREEALSAAEAKVCRGDGRLRCQVIGFFAGGQFKVYEFRRYDDVRLVFTPEFGVAFFGGDPDNFTFPRFDLDSPSCASTTVARRRARPPTWRGRRGPPRPARRCSWPAIPPAPSAAFRSRSSKACAMSNCP